MAETHDYEFCFHAMGDVSSSLPDDGFSGTIRDERICQIADAFAANVTRLVESVFTPMALMVWVRGYSFSTLEAIYAALGDIWFGSQEDATGLHLNIRNIHARFHEESMDPAKAREFILQASADVEYVRGWDSLVRTGLDHILAGTITAAWTAFETLASDLWEEALNAHPHGLALLSGKPPKGARKPKQPFTALAPIAEPVEESDRQVRLSYLQQHNYDLSGRMGTVLRDKFNFQIIDGIRKAYIQAFDDTHSDVRDAILHPSLTALAAVRNVLVHKAGIVDEKFMAAWNREEVLRDLFPDATDGQAFSMNGRTVRDLLEPAVTQTVKLIGAVAAVVDTDLADEEDYDE